MKHFYLISFWVLVLLSSSVLAQTSLKGKIIDRASKEPLFGAAVLVVGTYSGATADFDGKYEIKNLKPGDYSIKVSYVGYKDRVFNGIRIRKDEANVLNIDLEELGQSLETVEVVGEKQMVDLESGKSEVRISANDIKEMNVRNVQDVVAMQNGVTQTPDGIQIRGGRVYETQFVVDGLNAQDPLAGTGFGTEVGAGSLQDLTVITGGSDAEFNGNSGIIVAKIKEGGEKLAVFGRYQRDNLGFNRMTGTAWNTDLAEISIGTPIPYTDKKLRLFTSVNVGFSDEYPRMVANQLKSSLLADSSFWAPRQDNKWANTIKLSYYPKQGLRISLTNQHSIMVNQNTRTLQIIGFDQIMQPGLQYPFSLNLDNATTYTHRSNLTALNISKSINKNWLVDFTGGRFFTRLRADANGRPFWPRTIDRQFDASSVVTDPVGVYTNPPFTNDSVQYSLPGPGLINNGGISSLWHDHFFEEITFKTKFTYNSDSKIHFVTFGQEHKEQEMLWIDVTRPWVGAPILLSDGTFSRPNRIGSSNDVWQVKPATGAFYAQDEIRYKGIIAVLGGRFEYWAPGKFADQAIDNPFALIPDQARRDYKAQSRSILGRRFKARVLPKVRVSFPVTENNVLYFNYVHSMRLAHPRFLYAGLDTSYQNRGFGANSGNPNLNPEVAVSYELGIKSQVTRDFGVTLTAFYKDQFDFIVNRTAEVIDPRLGNERVERTISINQDYARIRGVELGLNYRFTKSLRATFNTAYQTATGKSNTAQESLLQIKEQGNINTTKEQYLAWDRPWDIKGGIIFTPDTSWKILNVPLKGFRFFVASTYKSGLRYTPFTQTGVSELGRPVYEQVQTEINSKIGSAWFWTDLVITRDVPITAKTRISFSIEIKNITNHKNAQLVNPVTGRGYEFGDPLPFSQRDPVYQEPNNGGTPPMNPARFLQPRQIIYGVSFNF